MSTKPLIILPYYLLVILVNIVSDNGLLPYGTKQLSEPMLTHYQQNLMEYIFLCN